MNLYIADPNVPNLCHVVAHFLGNAYSTACHQRIDTGHDLSVRKSNPPGKICPACTDVYDTTWFGDDRPEVVAVWLSPLAHWWCCLYQLEGGGYFAHFRAELLAGDHPYRWNEHLGLLPSDRAAIEALAPRVPGFKPDALGCPLQLVWHRRPVRSSEYMREGGLAKGSPALKAWAEDHGEP